LEITQASCDGPCREVDGPQLLEITEVEINELGYTESEKEIFLQELELLKTSGLLIFSVIPPSDLAKTATPST
jgi:hypothetical protein